MGILLVMTMGVRLTEYDHLLVAGYGHEGSYEVVNVVARGCGITCCKECEPPKEEHLESYR